MNWRRRLIEEIAFFVKWGLIAALIAGFFFVLWLYRRMNDELRAEIERQCAAVYPHLRIRIRSAQLLPSEGIQLRGLRVSIPGLPRPASTLAEVEELVLVGPIDYKNLLSKQVPIEQIILRRPRLIVACDPEGRWNISHLIPLPKIGGKHDFPIRVENGALEILDLRGPLPRAMVYRDIQADIQPENGKDGGTSSAPSRRIRGTMTGEFLKRINFEGTLDPAFPSIWLTGVVESLELSPELHMALPREIANKLQPLEHLRAQLSLTFKMFWNGDSKPTVDFSLAGQINRGRLDDPRVPYPLTDIRGYFTASREGIVFSDVTAFSGSTAVVIRSARIGSESLSDLTELDVQIQNLRFDPVLLPLLPRVLQEEWPKYFPEGIIHLTAHYNAAGGSPRLHVIADVEEASFAYYRFPYRLQQVQGRLELTPERLGIQLVAMAGNQPVEIRGQVLNPLTAPITQISVSGQRIHLDDRLINAVLDSKTRQTLRSLHLSGTADIWLGLWQEEPRGTIHRHLEATLHGCAIRYEMFPYPISQISGRVIMEDDTWSFQQLRGTSGPAAISAHGVLLATREGSTFRLSFEATQVRLDTELKEAFRQEYIQHIWEELDPTGHINVLGTISYVTGQPLEVKLWANPVGRGLTLEPRSFPYRLEGIEGAFSYDSGKLWFQGLRGHHENTVFQGDGICRLEPSGEWCLDFSNLWIDRLVIDRTLLSALPEGLSRPLARLNVQGPLVVRGQFRLSRPPDRSSRKEGLPSLSDSDHPGMPSLQADWNVAISLVQNTIGTSLVFENLNGKILCQGRCSDGTFLADGYLALDALQVLGLPITQLRGPFKIQNEVITFGLGRAKNSLPGNAASPNTASSSPQPLVATLFGGTLSGTGRLKLAQPTEYEISLSLVDARFHELARDFHNSPTMVRGVVDAAVLLKGQGDDIHGLSGYGNFQLREADIYELPLMIALLKILSIRRPDTTAFSESAGQFRLAGRHVYLDSITFWGDAFSLTGQGEVDLDGNLKLVMRAMLGRREIQVPVVRELFRGASEQIVLVHVDGTLQEPLVRREPFPGVNEALQRFQLGGRSSRGPEIGVPWR